MSPRLAKALINGLLIGAAAIAIAPLLYMLSVSFMPQGEASALPPPVLPSHPTLANYRELFLNAGMGRYLVNSLLISTAITAVSLAFNLMAGYAFAKLEFKGRQKIFQVLLGALVIPAQVAMLPLFLLLKYMGLVNTYGAVIVPALATIFGIFLVRQYALSIPDEMLEAARVDGAGGVGRGSGAVGGYPAPDPALLRRAADRLRRAAGDAARRPLRAHACRSRRAPKARRAKRSHPRHASVGGQDVPRCLSQRSRNWLSPMSAFHPFQTLTPQARTMRGLFG